MTKNILKSILGLCLTLAAPAVLATRSYAANSADVQSQWYGALAVSDLRQGGTVATASGNGSAVSTTTTVMELYYNGPSTAAYVTIGASSMTFYAPLGVVDTTMGTGASIFSAGTFDLAASSMNTLGQLCDAINTQGLTSGVPGYHCTLTGGIRSDIATNVLPPSVVATNLVNNLAAVGGYQVPTGTATFMSLGIIPAQGRHVVLNYIVVNSTVSAGATAAPVQVYGVKAKYGVGANAYDTFGNPVTDSALAWQSQGLTSGSTTVFPLSTAVAEPWLEFGGGASAYSYKNAPTGNAYNGHVVIRVNTYGTGSPQLSTGFISAAWLEK